MVKALKVWFKKHNIRSKFFLSMFLSSVLGMLVIAVAASGLFAYAYIQIESKSAYNQIGYLSGQLDRLLNNIDNYGKALRANRAIQDLCTASKNSLSPAEHTHSVEAMEQIYNILQDNDTIHSASIFSHDGRLLITNDTRPTLTSLENIIPLKGNKAVLPIYRNVSYDTKAQVYTISMISSIYSYSTGELIGYLDLAWAESSISAIYNQYVTDTYDIFIVDNYGLIQSNKHPELINTRFDGIDNLKTSNDFARKFSGGKVIFTKPYPRMDWHFVYIIDAATFFAPALTILIIFAAISFVCLFLYFLLANKLSKTITSPLYALIDQTNTIRKGNWAPIDESLAIDPDIHALFTAFNDMLIAQEELRDRLLNSQKALDRLMLDALQAQINPHFLYNTLDTICSLAEIGESEKLTRMVICLSNFYRNCLSGGRMVVTLREELDTTRNYLEILKIRSIDRFRHVVDCPEELLDCAVPRLLLQPIVENSIEHGFSSLSSGGLITVQAYKQDDFLKILVIDNGSGLVENMDTTSVQSHSNYGLANVDQRIKLYYGTDCGIRLENRPEGGCIATLTLKAERISDEKL